MADYTGKTKARKPKRRKASGDDFPLYLHRSGNYAKKVRGRTVYFGKDRDAALALWLEQRDDLLAGRRILLRDGAGPTLADAANTLLDKKQAEVESGELSPRTLAGYVTAAKLLTKHFGRSKPLADLKPADFVEFRAKLAKGRSLVSLGNLLRPIRGILRHAYDFDLVERPIKFGVALKLPSETSLRSERQARGPRVFTAEEIRWMLNGRTVIENGQERRIPGAGPQLRAMILLGLNCGYGNTDCAKLEFRHLDLDAGWSRFPRPKTTIERRCPLWPETVAALREAIAVRKTPRDVRLADRVFVTKYRAAYVSTSQKPDGRVITTDSVGLTFGRLLRALGIKRDGLNFYVLRHLTETIGGGVNDQVAVDTIMGHTPHAADMAARYRQGIEDSRLVAVTDHIRAWLALPVVAPVAGDE